MNLGLQITKKSMRGHTGQVNKKQTYIQLTLTFLSIRYPHNGDVAPYKPGAITKKRPTTAVEKLNWKERNTGWFF